MIHVFRNEDGRWEVWTDTDVRQGDGRCIGCSATKREALKEATNELWADLEVCLGQLIEEKEGA
jgi:hypothetical protein